MARRLDTPAGPARVHEHGAGPLTLVLGHGAGGSVTAPDLQAVTAAVVAAGHRVVLVEQPYRVAGRRSAPPARTLDAAWTAVCTQLDPPGPLVVGGRSSGARVACRTARALGAAGVVALAFPLVAPNGASRRGELDGAGVPVLVVQGRTDRFGVPRGSSALRREVVRVPGDHALRRDADAVARAVVRWLGRLTA